MMSVSDTVLLSMPDWMSGQTLTLQGFFSCGLLLCPPVALCCHGTPFSQMVFINDTCISCIVQSLFFPCTLYGYLENRPFVLLASASLVCLFSLVTSARYSKRLSIEFFVNLLSDSVHCFLLKMYYNCLCFAYYCLSRDLHFYFYSPTKFRLYFRTERLCTSVCLSVFCLDVLSCSSVLSFVTLFS